MVKEIDRYVIQGLIGRGGMGNIWRAVNMDRGEIVAIKEINAQWTSSKKILEYFNNEFKVLERLCTKDVVRPIDFIEKGGQCFLVMGYLKGGSLADRLRRTPYLEIKPALSIIEKMLNVLCLTNKLRIIHRDIKPSNILFADRSLKYPKLADFGIAFLPSEFFDPEPFQRIGTLAYMSPEQLNGEPVSSRSDIYSLGLTLYKMLTGRLFFNEKILNVKEIKRSICHPFREHPGRYRPDLPFWIDELVMKMIARDPSKRPKSSEEVLEIIRKNSAD